MNSGVILPNGVVPAKPSRSPSTTSLVALPHSESPPAAAASVPVGASVPAASVPAGALLSDALLASLPQAAAVKDNATSNAPTRITRDFCIVVVSPPVRAPAGCRRS